MPNLAATDHAETTLPMGCVTFHFTDIEGSTKLWETQAEAMRVALACHDALLRESIGEAQRREPADKEPAQGGQARASACASATRHAVAPMTTPSAAPISTASTPAGNSIGAPYASRVGRFDVKHRRAWRLLVRRLVHRCPVHGPARGNIPIDSVDARRAPAHTQGAGRLIDVDPFCVICPRFAHRLWQNSSHEAYSAAPSQ
jgi:hypothetical protein